MKQDREEATVAIVSTLDDSNPRAINASIFVESKGIVYGKDIFLSMISYFRKFYVLVSDEWIWIL